MTRTPRFRRSVIMTLVLAAVITTGGITAYRWFNSGGAFGRAGERHPCADADETCAGMLQVSLDRSHPAAGTTTIGFDWTPAKGTSARGTVAALIGGPGGSNVTDPWLPILAPLTADWNLLVMDYRGVGRSEPLLCPDLPAEVAEPAATPEQVAACARTLGPQRVGHYTTSAVIDDLEDLRAALGIERLDVHGQSFGTLIGQLYAVRHPQRVRTLTLDGALPIDRDPWRRDGWEQAFTVIRQACAAAPACARRGDPATIWQAAIDRARTQLDPAIPVTDLAVLHSTFPSTGGGLIAAADAYRKGDPGALRDLVQRNRQASKQSPDDASAAADAERFGFTSHPQHLALTCTTGPVPYDRAAPPETRRAQLDKAFRALPAEAFAPFTKQEYAAAVPGRLSMLRTCAEWPAPPAPPTTKVTYPKVPTLVISGAADTTTPPSQGATVATRFPGATHLTISGARHWVAPETPCAATILTTFIRAARYEPGPPCAATTLPS